MARAVAIRDKAGFLNPHDALFKSVFSDAAHAAGVLQSCLPAELVSLVDWTALRTCPGSFVDEQLRERHTDLLFSAPWAGREGFLYVLYEHQSSADPWMAFRLLQYMMRIWEDLRRREPERSQLLAILPVVLHHSSTGWTAATELLDLFDLDPATRPIVQPYLPSFRFVLDDLTPLQEEALRIRAMSALGRLALASLKHGRGDNGRLVAWLSGWGQVLREVAEAPHGVHALALVMRYLAVVNERTGPEDLERALAGCLGPRVTQEVVMTYGEMLIEQGRQEGEARGRAATVLRMMRQRGLAVSDEQQQQILACVDLATLEHWSDHVLTVGSTAQLLKTA